MHTHPDLEQLRDFVTQKTSIFVLTGAGLSAASGIPTYRDHKGIWQHSEPIKHEQFMREAHYRQRYWARSMVGWKYVSEAEPNQSHHELQRFEQSGKQSLLLTQNVDGLHQKAGSKNVCDLHGRIDQVICMECSQKTKRSDLQTRLNKDNPWLMESIADVAPDGDADLEAKDIGGIHIPDCQQCGGVLKPHVVFFGDNVPKSRVQQAMNKLEGSDALWVIGSSLMVYSGLRFVRRAKELNIPVCILNLGKTRADDLADLKIEMDCATALSQISIKS